LIRNKFIAAIKLNNGGGHGYIADRTVDPSQYSAVVLERKLYGILKEAEGNLIVWETMKFY
jgi:hypothetical protein